MIRLDCICKKRYIERWFRKKKNRNIDSFYSHQKSGVAENSETKWILIYSSSRENLIGSYPAINEVRNDNDGSSSE